MPARAALLAPFALTSARGNAVTVARIARGLAARGIELRVWDRATSEDATIEEAVQAFAPAIVHAFHAWHVGPLALRIARRREVPLILTLTGTDANHDLFDPSRAAVVRRVLEGTSRIVVFHDSIGARVASALPDLRSRIVCIPQAADLPATIPFDLAAAWPELPQRRVLFALPAGIRAVKRPRLPLAAFDEVVARHPHARLLYVGPVLDDHEGAALLSELRGRPWARYIGEVPHAAMASLLSQVDVVLNCSESEGGMANSVLEAQMCARAVLVADIEGNRSLVEHEVTGLRFEHAIDLGRMAERLIMDDALRARLGAAAQARVATMFPPGHEIDGYLTVYESVTPMVTR